MRAAFIQLFLLLGAVAAPWGASAEAPPPITLKVERFDVVGDNPLSAPVTEQTLVPFVGEYAELAGLMAAVDALEQALKVAGHPFHRVSIAPTPEGTHPPPPSC